MSWTIHLGDVREVLRTFPTASVHCVCTSPPYWGLRNYSMPGQIGLERTPEEYIATMVTIFAEVRRILRPDGVLWCNLGDCYATGSGLAGRGAHTAANAGKAAGRLEVMGPMTQPNRVMLPGLKPKDLVGIPWRLAFALQEDGWYLRADVIWSKPNPMPESVLDRPTKSHEYLFLLSKSERYYYDAEAVRERTGKKSRSSGNKSRTYGNERGRPGSHLAHGIPWTGGQSRNRRSVWTITTQPFPGAHFATMPEAIPELCIQAGSSSGGCCASCHAPRTRILERGNPNLEQQRACGGDVNGQYAGEAGKAYDGAGAQNPSDTKRRILAGMVERRTVGWALSCKCPNAEVEPCVVLDPFAGAGTTLLVADRLGRDAIGVELNAEYREIARARIAADLPLLSSEVSA